MCSFISSSVLVFLFPQEKKMLKDCFHCDIYLYTMYNGLYNALITCRCYTDTVKWHLMKCLAKGYGLLKQLKQKCCWGTKTSLRAKSTQIFSIVIGAIICSPTTQSAICWDMRKWDSPSVMTAGIHFFSDKVIPTIPCLYLPLAHQLKFNIAVCISASALASFFRGQSADIRSLS